MSYDPPSLIASRYRVLRELGRGGMGVVYLVEHLHTGDHLALKVLLGRAAEDADSIKRFGREARASARIKSEHIVKVVDADVAPELQGAPFLVMELLVGSDLQDLLVARGRLPPAEVCDYLGQAARALDKSHDLGIVHRDLKPGNLFLHRREDGTTILKVLDFGISKFLTDQATDPSHVSVTHTGAIMGTPLYMAPEQARGQIAKVAPATDVWAMGVIALQLLTGEIYWSASNISDMLVQILSEPLYPPTSRWPWLPPRIDAWFARACAREPGDRFPRVGELVQSLAEAFGGAVVRDSGVPVQRVSDPPSFPRATPQPEAGPGRITTTGATIRDGALVAARARTQGSRRLMPLAFGAIALAGTAASAWSLRQHFSSSTAREPIVALDAALSDKPAVSSRLEDAAPAVQAPPTATPSPVPTPAPAPNPPLVATTPRPISGQPAPRAHRQTETPIHAPSAPDCDPAYTIDPATGHHVLKPECK